MHPDSPIRRSALVWLPLILMLGALGLRVLTQHGLLDGMPNLSPLMAFAFAGAVVFPRPMPWWSWALILLGIDLASDGAAWWAQAHGRVEVLASYACYAAAACIGARLRGRAGVVETLLGTLACSVFYYLVSNTVSWITDPVYTKTAAGWVQALTTGTGAPGLPPTTAFFRNSLIADLGGRPCCSRSTMRRPCCATSASFRGLDSGPTIPRRPNTHTRGRNLRPIRLKHSRSTECLFLHRFPVTPKPHHRRKPDPSEDPGPDPAAPEGLLSRPEVRIAIAYVLVASLWIICSDALLSRWAGGQADTVFFQTFKGMNFVITTGLLLFFVLRRAYGGWRHSEERRMAAMRPPGNASAISRRESRTCAKRSATSISREIHDELGQLLTGIKMQLRLIEDHLNERNDRWLNPAIDDLVEASALVDETINAVRRISSGLRPLALDLLGLGAALDDEIEQFSRRTGIECHLTVGEMRTPFRRRWKPPPSGFFRNPSPTSRVTPGQAGSTPGVRPAGMC